MRTHQSGVEPGNSGRMGGSTTYAAHIVGPMHCTTGSYGMKITSAFIPPMYPYPAEFCSGPTCSE